MRKIGTLTMISALLIVAISFAASCSEIGMESEIVLIDSATSTVQIPTLTRSPTSIATTISVPEPLPTLAPTPVPTVIPEQMPEQVIAEPIVETNTLAELKSLLKQEVAAYPGHWISVCVTDLQSSGIVCLDGESQRDTGCVIDLFALFVAVEEFEVGRASPEDYVESAGTSLATQIRAGIGSSSPNNAAIFLASVKGESLAEGTYRARGIVTELGLANTIFGYVPYNKIESNSPANLTTAQDMNTVLTKLWKGEIFSQNWTDYTIQVLTESEYTDTMPDLVQHKGARVAHKIGYFGYESGYDFAVWNDAGIVFWEKDGRQLAFALSVFTQGPWAGKNIVANLANISYEYINSNY